MITAKNWSIKIDKDGIPCIIIPDEKYPRKEVIQLASEDVTFMRGGFKFWYAPKNKESQEYECLYKFLDRYQKATPLSELIRLGAIKEEQQHSLVFLYEVISGVVFRTVPVVKDKSWDFDALLNKYSYLGEQIQGVDFKWDADSLYRRLTCKGVNKNEKYFFE